MNYLRVYLFLFKHDCQEFLALLLDGLHEQLNLAKKKGNPFSDNSRDLPCSSLKVSIQYCYDSGENTVTRFACSTILWLRTHLNFL